jgi:hypothetical protein
MPLIVFAIAKVVIKILLIINVIFGFVSFLQSGNKPTFTMLFFLLWQTVLRA